jgi:RHS repeat-associated protein
MVNAGSGGVHFPAYDLNGNVMGLVNATNGNISAKYEYGPFGEVFCSVGDMAKVNPFQFSTQYTDTETDLLYYGYRYYSPVLGRWLSRDPIEEQGGLNLYAFVNNDPVNKWDKLGLDFASWCNGGTCYHNFTSDGNNDNCVFSYNFGVDDGFWEKIGDWINGPRRTKWLSTMNEVQEDIERQMKQRNCCCIPLIYFTQHGGIPGYLALGESTSIDIGYLDMLRDEMKIAAEKQFLKYVSKKMCKGGKIVFMQCMSGEGEDGERLEKWLKGIIGNDIKLELFKTKVRWCRRRIVEVK